MAHRIDEASRVVVMTMSTPITLADLVNDYQKIFEHRQFKHNMNAIWDISQVNLQDVPIDQVRQLPRAMKQFMERRGSNYKAAIVTSRPFDFQLARAYVTILRLLGNVRFRVFRSVKEAFEWTTEVPLHRD